MATRSELLGHRERDEYIKPAQGYLSFILRLSSFDIHASKLKTDNITMTYARIIWKTHSQKLLPLSAPVDDMFLYSGRQLSERVMTARMSRYTDPSDDDVIVVVKMAYSENQLESLEYEYSLYNNELRHLQGTVVPACLGLYQADPRERPGDSHILACMIIEYRPGIRMHPYENEYVL